MKETICKIFAHFLYRGIKVLYKKDERVRNEIDRIPENSAFVFKFGIEDDAKFFAFEKTEKGLKKRKFIKDGDIQIIYKTLDLAYESMTGKKGLTDSYAQHDFVLKGNVNVCMQLVRVIEIVMAHLLPKKTVEKILREVPERKMNMICLYVRAIFGN